MDIRSIVPLVLAALAAAPVAVAAAAPPNDSRANATSLDPLPATTQGTTQDATADPEDFSSACGDAGDSVWYSATAATTGRIALQASASGDLDMIIDVVRRIRSVRISGRMRGWRCRGGCG